MQPKKSKRIWPWARRHKRSVDEDRRSVGESEGKGASTVSSKSSSSDVDGPPSPSPVSSSSSHSHTNGDGSSPSSTRQQSSRSHHRSNNRSSSTHKKSKRRFKPNKDNMSAEQRLAFDAFMAKARNGNLQGQGSNDDDDWKKLVSALSPDKNKRVLNQIIEEEGSENEDDGNREGDGEALGMVISKPSNSSTSSSSRSSSSANYEAGGKQRKKQSPSFMITVIACIAIAIGLILKYAPGTSFDDEWSMTLPDASLLLDDNGLASGSFQFDGGWNGHTKLVGKYYLPSKNEQRGPSPAVIMTQGLGLMQDCSLNNFIEAFRSEGMAVFTFDYATFGHSQGLPRHEVDPKTHISDINAALEAVRNQFSQTINVERIALWGTSLAGGHVLSAALSRDATTNTNIKAVVAQVPHIASGTEGVLNTVLSDPITYIPALGMILAGFIKAAILRTTNQMIWYLPLHGTPGSAAAMQNPGDDEGYRGLCKSTTAKETGVWRNAYTATSVLRMLLYRPMNLIIRQNKNRGMQQPPPILLVGAENDTLCAAKYVEAAATQIKGSEMLILEGASHFDVYEGPFFEQAIQREVSFLKSHLFVDETL